MDYTSHIYDYATYKRDSKQFGVTTVIIVGCQDIITSVMDRISSSVISLSLVHDQMTMADQSLDPSDAPLAKLQEDDE